MKYEVEITAKVVTSYEIEADTPADAEFEAGLELEMDVGGSVHVDRAIAREIPHE